MDLIEIPSDTFERHPWEISRFNFFKDLLLKFLNINEIKKILDVGAGDTWFSTQLLGYISSDAKIVCWDKGYETLPPKVDFKLDFTKEPPQEKFQLIFLLDVLEHVEDDENFFKIVLKCLEKEGYLLLSVPAWNSIMSNHDKALNHYRRYNPSEIHHLIEKEGLKIILSGGLFHSLLPLRFFILLLEKIGFIQPLKEHRLEWKNKKSLKKNILKMLYLDNTISLLAALKCKNIPGLSWWALCQKDS